MFKKTVCMVILALSMPTVFADYILSIQLVTGDVTVKAPGGEWQAAEVGMLLEVNWAINTAQEAFVVLAYEETVINVMPLSRLTIEELLETEGLSKTTLDMQAGRLSASVRTPGKENDFTVRTPISTASVRGTEFTFDGCKVAVISGQVDFANSYNIKVAVAAGSTVVNTGSPVPELPVTVATTAAEVSAAPVTNLKAQPPVILDTPETGIPEQTLINLILR